MGDHEGNDFICNMVVHDTHVHYVRLGNMRWTIHFAFIAIVRYLININALDQVTITTLGWPLGCLNPI